MLELFYAYSIRVSELCSWMRTTLIAGPQDQSGVQAQGDRTPRAHQLHARPARGGPAGWPADRPHLATAASGTALFLGVHGGRFNLGISQPDRARALPGEPEQIARRQTRRHPPQHSESPAQGQRRPARRPGVSRPRLASDKPDIHKRLDQAAPVQSPAGPSPQIRSASTRVLTELARGFAAGHDYIVVMRSMNFGGMTRVRQLPAEVRHRR